MAVSNFSIQGIKDRAPNEREAGNHLRERDVLKIKGSQAWSLSIGSA